jgi:hypothetical protein
MDGLSCRPSRFMFVSVFLIQASVQHTASPTTGRLMAIIRQPAASAILFLAVFTAEAQRRGESVFFRSSRGNEAPIRLRVHGSVLRVLKSQSLLTSAATCQPGKKGIAFPATLCGSLRLCVSAVKSFGSLTPWRDAIRRGLLPGRRPAQPSLLRWFPSRC